MAPNKPIALLFAGGRAHRLGREKQLVDRHGQPTLRSLVEEFGALDLVCFVAVDGARDFAGALPGAARWWDREAGAGPLPALLRSLRRLGEPVLAWAADRPLPPFALLRSLWETDAEFATVADVAGQLDPLAAVYRPQVLEPLAAAHAAGEQSLRRFLETAGGERVRRKKFALDDWPADLDHRDDLSAFRAGSGRADER